MKLFADQALLKSGWASDVSIEAEGGVITAIAANATRPLGARAVAAMPGMVNLHSHAFQRGMAGLTEHRGSNVDSFWTWRDAMYRFIDRVTPEDCQALAALAYIEMLESGFVRVGEFHYLHHDIDGTPYGDPAEMAARIVEAARATGISITLLPVLYSYANFGAVAPSHGQRRFLSSPDSFARLFASAETHVADLKGANIGVAPHSLRGVDKTGLHAAVGLAGTRPIHMHIAEQVREVEDGLAWSGQRPVEWLLDNAPVDSRWCLIHATHMTDGETRSLARTGAVAGLCPVTEANLGDGTFAAEAWIAESGAFGFGTDSNVAIGLADELKQLEYSLRLHRRQRNVLALGHASTGRALFEAGLYGGAQATGQTEFGIKVGAPASLFTLELDHAALAHRRGDDILDSWIFGRAQDTIGSVFVAGEEVVRDGRHLRRETIERSYSERLGRLLAAL